MKERAKVSTGSNDRPRNEAIGQSGAGWPDDSSRPVDVRRTSVERMTRQFQDGRYGGPLGTNPEAVPADTEGAGENICRRCAGRGLVDSHRCSACGGSGKVYTPIGGG